MPLNCYLFCAAWHGEHTGDHVYGQNPDKDNDKVFCMQHCGVIKAAYTHADKVERERFAAMQPLKSGDIVTIDGHGDFQFTLVGNFSDAGYFTKVN